MKKYAIIILLSTVGALWGADESPSSSVSEDMAYDASSNSDVDELLASSGMSVDPEVIERVTQEEKAAQDAIYKKQAAEWEKLRKEPRFAKSVRPTEKEKIDRAKDNVRRKRSDLQRQNTSLEDSTNKSQVKIDKTDQLVQQLKNTASRMMAKAVYYTVPAGPAAVVRQFYQDDEENDDPWL